MSEQAKAYDCRETFVETLIQLAREDERVVAVCNDSVGSSKLGAFQEEFPERLINVGIAEQNMVGVGAGLANAGLIPFVSAAGPFLSGRATEQIKADVAYSGAKVILCAQSPGMAYGDLGPTHHSVEDLSWMRAVAGLPVVAPADPAQTADALRWAVEHEQGSYLRIPRSKIPETTPPDSVFRTGKAVQLVEGSDATIMAIGGLVHRALEAASLLATEGISVRVLNMTFVEPLDHEAVLDAARETGGIVTAEEATVSGGLGAAVASYVSQHAPVPMRILGLHDFAPTGSSDELFDHFGLNVAGLIAAVKDVHKHAER